MSILAALKNGITSVLHTKRFVALVFSVNIVFALIFAVSIGDGLYESFGSSSAADRMLDGFDGLWYSGYSAQATGLASAFNPALTQIGAVFNGLDSFLSGNLFGGYIGFVILGVSYLILWTFFAAGLLVAYNNKSGNGLFFQGAVRFFPRFLILAFISWILYYLLFTQFFGLLAFIVEEMNRETIDERIHFLWTVIQYVLFWTIVWCVNIVFDYAKILIVLDDVPNVVSAPILGIQKAFKVVFSNFLNTFGLYVVLGIVWIAIMFLYWLVVPGAGISSWITIAGAFIIGQLYLISRIWVRCLFYASQTTMCHALAKSE